MKTWIIRFYIMININRLEGQPLTKSQINLIESVFCYSDPSENSKFTEEPILDEEDRSLSTYIKFSKKENNLWNGIVVFCHNQKHTVTTKFEVWKCIEN